MDLLKTPLHGEHISLKAKMASFAGFDMPIQYTSVKEECLAVRENCGIFDVSHMGEFLVEGSDAHKFVDYLITNDFINAGDNKAVYSPLCRDNGTVIDDLIAYKLDQNKVLICVNASNIKKDWDWISSKTNDFDVRLQDQSDQTALIAVQGPNTEKILRSLDLLPEGDFPYYSVKPGSFEGGSVLLARTGYTGEDGFEVFCDNDKINSLWNKLKEAGATPCGLAARDVLRMEVCYPLYGHELNDELTPLDANLKWTVKLEKPLFLGKDSLTTTKPKYRLAKLSLEKGIPREGYPILNTSGETIGRVTSGTHSVSLGKGICLALVERKHWPENKDFSIQIRNNIFPAKYHTKPFFSGGHK